MTEERLQVMPPEWFPHKCTWMAWPSSATSSQEVWRIPEIKTVQNNVSDVVRAVAQYEEVHMIADNEKEVQIATIMILYNPLPLHQIHFHICETNDNIWMRDIGPTFCTNPDGSQLRSVSWIFNSWGRKFEPWDKDAKVSDVVSDIADAEVYQSPLTVEGGSIHNDGEGTLLITESSVLNKNRNPGWTKEAVEVELKKALDAQIVLWLPGLSSKFDPITDGHVDGIACFARPGVVLFNSCILPDEGCDKMDKAYAAAVSRNRHALQNAIDAQGRQLTIIDIPECDEVLDSPLARRSQGEFCNSYINFYLTNGSLVAPAFGYESDLVAKNIFQDTFPNHEVVMVNITGIACGGGGIHCITQQQPMLS